nr:uncharacterized mitochondrial protein AtMg00810-like [Tanacetum cinerariifolium]
RAATRGMLVWLPELAATGGVFVWLPKLAATRELFGWCCRTAAAILGLFGWCCRTAAAILGVFAAAVLRGVCLGCRGSSHVKGCLFWCCRGWQPPRGRLFGCCQGRQPHRKYGFESCDPLDTPMVEKSKLDEDKEGKAIDPSHYHGMIGTLLYLTASRSDLQFAICMCARYEARPTEKHSDRLREEAQRENDEFLRTVDENKKKIIKEQVKEQVKAQVSKIFPRIEQAVNEQLEAEVLTRSSHSSRTSYTTSQMEEPLHLEFETGAEDQLIIQSSQHPE